MVMGPPQGYVASSVIPQELWYDVRDYGADPSGIADSTTAIQNAIEAAELTSGTVFFPAGNYLISAMLDVEGAILLQGLGAVTAGSMGARIFTNTNGITMLQFSLTVGAGNQTSGGGIDGILLDGNNNASIGLKLTGVQTTKLRFMRLQIIQCTHLGLYTDANHSFSFFACLFALNGPTAGAVATDGGIQIDGAVHVNFYGCNFEKNHGSGCVITGGHTINFYGGVNETNDFDGILHPSGTPTHVAIEGINFEANNQTSTASKADLNIGTGTYWNVKNCLFNSSLVAWAINVSGGLCYIENCRTLSTPKINITATSGFYIGDNFDLLNGTAANGVTRLLKNAGIGIPNISAATIQRSETAADTNVLTLTPPAIVGSYRLQFVISVSAATAATLGWTATWKDSNGTAQAPTNLDLIKNGVAAPGLTFVAAAGDTYVGDANIDIDNSATAIVCKLTFTGTSFTAKVSAFIEQLA